MHHPLQMDLKPVKEAHSQKSHTVEKRRWHKCTGRDGKSFFRPWCVGIGTSLPSSITLWVNSADSHPGVSLWGIVWMSERSPGQQIIKRLHDTRLKKWAKIDHDPSCLLQTFSSRGCYSSIKINADDVVFLFLAQKQYPFSASPLKMLTLTDTTGH